jgi:hypothetical protein
MELDFSSVGVDIWFLPHVRYVVLSNYSLYSSIRWSPAVVIGHRILRLDCCWCLLFLFFILLNYTQITFDFYTLSNESQIDMKDEEQEQERERERWTFPLPFYFRIEKKRKEKGASSLTLVKRGREWGHIIFQSTPISDCCNDILRKRAEISSHI